MLTRYSYLQIMHALSEILVLVLLLLHLPRPKAGNIWSKDSIRDDLTFMDW